MLLPTKRILSASNEELLLQLLRTNPSPLFAHIAVGIMKEWPSYSPPESTIYPLVEAAERDGIRGLINMLFDRLESQHGKVFVATALGVLTVMREGLSEREWEVQYNY